jgi:hypothetical protein
LYAISLQRYLFERGGGGLHLAKNVFLKYAVVVRAKRRIF